MPRLDGNDGRAGRATTAAQTLMLSTVFPPKPRPCEHCGKACNPYVPPTNYRPYACLALVLGFLIAFSVLIYDLV